MFSISYINHYLNHEFAAGVSKIGFSIKKHFYGSCFHGIWSCMGPEGGPSAKVFGRGRLRREETQRPRPKTFERF